MPRHLAMLLLLAAVGCRESTAPDDLSGAAGVYTLVSYDGCAIGDSGCPPWVAIFGTMVLAPDGHAVRGIDLQREGEPLTHEVLTGTFTLQGRRVQLALRDESTDSPYTWRTTATLSGDTLTLRYPDPADGTVEEVYVRNESLPLAPGVVDARRARPSPG